MTYLGHLAAGLAELRAVAEARMTSRVTIHRKLPVADWPVVNGIKVPTWTTPHVDLPFRLDGSAANDGGSVGVRIGDVVFQGATSVGHVPAATRDLEDDDFVEITSGEAAGRVLRIEKATLLDQKTARRFPLADVQRPEEW